MLSRRSVGLYAEQLGMLRSEGLLSCRPDGLLSSDSLLPPRSCGLYEGCLDSLGRSKTATSDAQPEKSDGSYEKSDDLSARFDDLAGSIGQSTESDLDRSDGQYLQPSDLPVMFSGLPVQPDETSGHHSGRLDDLPSKSDDESRQSDDLTIYPEQSDDSTDPPEPATDLQAGPSDPAHSDLTIPDHMYALPHGRRPASRFHYSE